MKKVTSLLLSFTLLFTAFIFTGCSKEETELSNLIKEITDLQGYESTGDITFKFNLEENQVTDLDETSKAILEQLKDLTITYKESYIKETGKFRILLYTKDSVTKQDTQIADIIYDKENLYIQVDKTWEFARKFITDEVLKQRIDTVLKNTKYIKITNADLKNLDSDYNSFEDVLGDLKQNLNKGLDNEQQQLILNFYNKLLKVYEGFTTGAVTKNGNNYVFSVDANKSVDLFYNFSIYTLDNTEKLADVIKTFIKETDQDKLDNLFSSLQSEDNSGITNTFTEIATSAEDQTKQLAETINEGYTYEDPEESSTSINKDEIISTIDKAVAEIAKNRESYKLMLGAILARDEVKQAKGWFEGSKIEYSLGKTDDKTYAIKVDYLIKMKNPENTTQNLYTFGYGLNGTIKSISDFEVIYPNEKVITLSEITNRTNSLPTIFSIDISSGEYGLYNGLDNQSYYLDFIIEQNRTYVPLRSIGEMLGEDVNWDETRKVPYIKQNDKNIDMTGIIQQDSTYVKIRDFEKLGYKVEYDQSTNKVTLSK